ncbi:hypothetical protein GMI70_07025 [Eggerthellaceae bacterium zg-893]|nr:hypothetical protein [Eggerthellaceae bacterium zg-893]
MKLEKMKANTAGEYIPARFADEVTDMLFDLGASEDFVDGANFVLDYLTCPKGADMHGASAYCFFRNFISATLRERLDRADEEAVEGYFAEEGPDEAGTAAGRHAAKEVA